MRVIWVRHGETPWNREYRLQGRSEVALNERGQWQADCLAACLNGPVDRIYVSPLGRAKAFAAPFAARHGLVPEVLDNLMEICFGRWEGLRYADMDGEMRQTFEAWCQDPVKYCPPEGECMQSVAARVKDVLASITMNTGEEMTCVVFTHGGIIRTAVTLLMDMPLSAAARIQIDTASVTVVEKVAGAWKLIRLNDTCHLSKQE